MFLKTGELIKKLKGHTQEITHLVVNEQTSTLFSSSLDCEIRSWTMRDNNLERTFKLPGQVKTF
jgi:WD40 repeat protein